MRQLQRLSCFSGSSLKSALALICILLAASLSCVDEKQTALGNSGVTTGRGDSGVIKVTDGIDGSGAVYKGVNAGENASAESGGTESTAS
jgi:hypothetical protein